MQIKSSLHANKITDEVDWQQHIDNNNNKQQATKISINFDIFINIFVIVSLTVL